MKSSLLLVLQSAAKIITEQKGDPTHFSMFPVAFWATIRNHLVQAYIFSQ